MLVHRLNISFWLAVSASVVCAVILLFAIGNFKGNRKTLIICILLPLFYWPMYMLKRNNVLKECDLFIGKIQLENFKGKENCQLEIKDNFHFEVKYKNKTIKKGEWDVPKGGKLKVCILDESYILGQGEFEIKHKE